MNLIKYWRSLTTLMGNTQRLAIQVFNVICKYVDAKRKKKKKKVRSIYLR